MVSLKSDKKSLFDGRKMWFFFAAAAAVVSAGVIFSVLSAVSSTASYWMIKDGTEVAARQPITPDMLQQVTVPRESAPKNILSLSEIEAAVATESTDDDFYALYALTGGDIITNSNVATLNKFANIEIPANSVLASFKANPSDAAGGVVKEGSLIDIAVIYQVGSNYEARYILSKVRVVKATADLDGSNGSEGGVAGSPLGAPVLYTVAITPDQAAALAVASRNIIYITVTNDSMPNVAGKGMSLTDALAGVLSANSSAVVEGTDPNAGVDGTTDSTTTDSNASTDGTTVDTAPSTKP